MYRNEKVFSANDDNDNIGCSLVTFITLIDFSMLLETSRCMPQNKEEKEMTKLRDACHATQKQ